MHQHIIYTSICEILVAYDVPIVHIPLGPLQYAGFTPPSIIIDIIRVATTKGVRGRGWLLFFFLLEMACKVGGAGGSLLEKEKYWGTEAQA